MKLKDIHIIITEELFEKIRYYKYLKNITFATFIKQAIEFYFENHEGKK